MTGVVCEDGEFIEKICDEEFSKIILCCLNRAGRYSEIDEVCRKKMTCKFTSLECFSEKIYAP